MTEIPQIFEDHLVYVDLQSVGHYALGVMTLAEELHLPSSVNKYNNDDYQNDEAMWADAMLDARQKFKDALDQLEKQRQWEEDDMWADYEYYQRMRRGYDEEADIDYEDYGDVSDYPIDSDGDEE